jgi:hypothetical protein
MEVRRLYYSEWEHQVLIEGSGGWSLHYSVFSRKWERRLELRDRIDDPGWPRSRIGCQESIYTRLDAHPPHIYCPSPFSTFLLARSHCLDGA